MPIIFIKLFSYWGQDIAAGGQQDINNYCQDNTIDNIVISFLDTFFSTGGEPELNLMNVGFVL
jgi:chitinase